MMETNKLELELELELELNLNLNLNLIFSLKWAERMRKQCHEGILGDVDPSNVAERKPKGIATTPWLIKVYNTKLHILCCFAYSTKNFFKNQKKKKKNLLLKCDLNIIEFNKYQDLC